MKNKNFTLILITVFLGVIYYLSLSFIYKETTKKIITQQVETSKNQASLIAKFLERQIINGEDKEKVKNDFQSSIENSSTAVSFVCMFDNTGKEICHPNKAKIGKVLEENNSIITNITNPELIRNFKTSILTKQNTGGLRKLKNYTEVVYLNPVKNTNWIVASHASIERFKTIFEDLKLKLSFLFLLIWLVSSLLIYFFLDRIQTANLNRINTLNKKVAKQYFDDLQAINNQIKKTATTKELFADRFLAERKAQLLPVYTIDIAYIYTENKMSYIVNHNGEIASINISLEELFQNLDPKQFYRASRKVILAIKAIKKIEKYGTTQLRVITNPEATFPIIISKAKLTDFKKWIGSYK